jgi:2-keto-4-pentenoate hydratase/2-oxohepta-3-ene-1,7-dioic acid hydratase in catechol pathway
MRLCRFNDNRLGLVEDETIIDVTAALDAIPAQTWPLKPGDPLAANLPAVCKRAAEVKDSGEKHALADVKLLSPIATPSKVIGAPVNYSAHADEAKADQGVAHGQTILSIEEYGPFLKASSSLVGASEGVALRFTDRRNDHEVELAAIIGKVADRVPEDGALDYVCAYSIGLDMTVRGKEDRSVRKSIDSYSVLGPWLVTADEIADPNNLDFSITVGDEVRQKSNTSYLIYNVQKLVSWCSSFYALYPGDVIMTGTPEGVGPVTDGDVMVCEMEGIGRMDVAVRQA